MAKLRGVRLVQRELRKLADKQRVPELSRFFKCGPGEYGEGDKFIGVTVPLARSVHKAHREAISTADELTELLASPFNEERFLGLLYMIDVFEQHKSSQVQRTQHEVVQWYLNSARSGRINNWNLVDCSAPNIVGTYYKTVDDRQSLHALVADNNMWIRRIGVVATLALIRAGQLDDTFVMCRRLIEAKEQEDLMHKACGWMMREAGIRKPDALRSFLETHIADMPRTMLRYSIEKFDPDERADFLARPSNVLKKRSRSAE
jgi:3-methyladenine DNA glycosylase AlkD